MSEDRNDGNVIGDAFKASLDKAHMTKREIIAMHAMQGLCADVYSDFSAMAHDAVVIADALLLELSK